MKEKVKKLLSNIKIINKIMQVRIHASEWFATAYPYYKARKKNSNLVFFVMTPEHSNVGDHAIALAADKILHEFKIEYMEVTCEQLSKLSYAGYLDVFNGADIVVNGGGNLGTLWFSIEKLFRELLIYNPDSRIIVLPNTIYYEHTDFGMAELKKSIDIYNKHNKLTIFAREQTSYKMMRKIYHDVKLVPDIVLTLNYSTKQFERDGCLLCLRNDCERTLTDDQQRKLVQIASKLFNNKVRQTDMCIGTPILVSERAEVVRMKAYEFAKAELVITDRLHAMIFCAITATPCIVVNSRSPKVLGCYKWLINLENIKIAENISDIAQLYQAMRVGRSKYSVPSLEAEFQELYYELRKLQKN